MQDVFDFFKDRQPWEREAILLPNGKIIEACPSHLLAMIRLTGKTEKVIYDEMPIISSPIYWLVEYSGCVATWENFAIAPSKITKEQEQSLDVMLKNNIIKRVGVVALSKEEMDLIDMYRKIK